MFSTPRWAHSFNPRVWVGQNTTGRQSAPGRKGSTMTYLRLSNSIVICVVTLLFTAALSAQSDYGSITGFVKDPSGAVVPNAKVVVKNEGNGEERSILTNESGYYVVPSLQP